MAAPWTFLKNMVNAEKFFNMEKKEKKEAVKETKAVEKKDKKEDSKKK